VIRGALRSKEEVRTPLGEEVALLLEQYESGEYGIIAPYPLLAALVSQYGEYRNAQQHDVCELFRRLIKDAALEDIVIRHDDIEHECGAACTVFDWQDGGPNIDVPAQMWTYLPQRPGSTHLQELWDLATGAAQVDLKEAPQVLPIFLQQQVDLGEGRRHFLNLRMVLPTKLRVTVRGSACEYSLVGAVEYLTDRRRCSPSQLLGHFVAWLPRGARTADVRGDQVETAAEWVRVDDGATRVRAQGPATVCLCVYQLGAADHVFLDEQRGGARRVDTGVADAVASIKSLCADLSVHDAGVEKFVEDWMQAHAAFPIVNVLATVRRRSGQDLREAAEAAALEHELDIADVLVFLDKFQDAALPGPAQSESVLQEQWEEDWESDFDGGFSSVEEWESGPEEGWDSSPPVGYVERGARVSEDGSSVRSSSSDGPDESGDVAEAPASTPADQSGKKRAHTASPSLTRSPLTAPEQSKRPRGSLHDFFAKVSTVQSTRKRPLEEAADEGTHVRAQGPAGHGRLRRMRAARVVRGA
jgi:hypothetical protein